MKRFGLGLLVSGVTAAALAALVAACDDAASSNAPPATGEAGAFDGGGGGDSGPAPAAEEVDCSHPGAGAKKANGKCECPRSLTVLSGVWNGLYTCAESGVCVDNSVPEEWIFEQTGNKLHAQNGVGGAAPSFVWDGIVCGEYFQWSGGPTSGKYVECGTLRFTDANHYVKDSCYQYAADGGAPPACDPSFSTGCGTQSGICTNTGARSPEAAPPITKNVCP